MRSREWVQLRWEDKGLSPNYQVRWMRRSAKASKKKWPVNRKEVMTGWGSGSWEKKVYPGRENNACMLNHFSRVRFFGTWWTVACQAPLSMGFFRQEFWSELPFPPPGDLPDPGIKPNTSCIGRQFFTTVAPEAKNILTIILSKYYEVIFKASPSEQLQAILKWLLEKEKRT